MVVNWLLFCFVQPTTRAHWSTIRRRYNVIQKTRKSTATEQPATLNSPASTSPWKTAKRVSRSTPNSVRNIPHCLHQNILGMFSFDRIYTYHYLNLQSRDIYGKATFTWRWGRTTRLLMPSRKLSILTPTVRSVIAKKVNIIILRLPDVIVVLITGSSGGLPTRSDGRFQRPGSDSQARHGQSGSAEDPVGSSHADDIAADAARPESPSRVSTLNSCV